MNHFKFQLSDTFQLVDQVRVYHYKNCMEFLLERGKFMYGGHFVITKSQKEVFYKLLVYAIEEPKILAKQELDLSKGILLMGEPGTGKTAFMRLIQSFFLRRKNYEIKTCRLLAQEFSHKGFEVFTPFFEPNAKALCLDNLGNEPLAKNYGNVCDVIPTLVEHFYEQRFDLKFPKLHGTTALSPQEIEKRYGIAFRKRLQAMFNVIICE